MGCYYCSSLEGTLFYCISPIVTEVIVSSHQKDFKAKYRASIFVVMVRNVQAKFEISLDREMLSWFKHRQGMQIPFRSVDDILNICQDFGQEQWDSEYDYWQDVKNNPNRLCCMKEGLRAGELW